MLSITFFLVLVSQINSILTDCYIDIQKELPAKDPLLVTSEGELWTTTGSKLEFSKGKSGYAICSGSKNSFVKDNNEDISLKCENNKIKVNDANTKIADYECHTSISGDVINLGESCSNTGTLHLIGFNTKKFKFIEYIKVCYNLKQASVVYTYHKIRGQSIDNSISNNIRPVFKLSAIPKHAKPGKSYRQLSQVQRLKELLKSEKLANEYINKTSFLARGHLTPDNDGIFKTWQYATYFYINVAPQWQIVNSGNWLRVENIARKKAANLKSDLEVYTGVYDILTLPDINGNEVPISLEPNENIIVPKWYWKILKYQNEGIVFVTLNNPFATEVDYLCENICKKYGWDNKSFEEFTKGYTYCCAVNDFISVIHRDAPQGLRVPKILKF